MKHLFHLFSENYNINFYFLITFRRQVAVILLPFQSLSLPSQVEKQAEQGEGFPRPGGSTGKESTTAVLYSPAHPPAHGAVLWAGRQGADFLSGATHYAGVIPDNSLESVFQTNVTNKHCSENIFND